MTLNCFINKKRALENKKPLKPNDYAKYYVHWQLQSPSSPDGQGQSQLPQGLQSNPSLLIGAFDKCAESLNDSCISFSIIYSLKDFTYIYFLNNNAIINYF